MTHEEWVGQIVQAVHAANQGNNQELHRLASLLKAHDEATHEPEDTSVAEPQQPTAGLVEHLRDQAQPDEDEGR